MNIRFLVVTLFLVLPVSAAADAPALMTLGDVERGQLLFRTTEQGRYAPAPLVATEVKIKVGGIVARTIVRQHFVNPTDEWLEGRYVFPLPENSAVNRMTLTVGDRVIEAKIAERRAARKAYAKARQEGRRAALVEQHRPNMFSNNVANIPPGGRIAVELTYLQQLRFDQGKFSLHFPLVVAPRFDPADARRRLARYAPDGTGPQPTSATTPIMIPIRDTTKVPPLNPVTLTVSLDAGMALDDIASPTHKLDVSFKGTGKRDVSLADKAVPADRDFVLSWTPKLGAAPLTATFRETIGDDVYLLAMIMPPASTTTHAAQRPRDIVFILDRSGSMGGESIRAARHALDAAIDRLNDTDRFNLIRFSSDTDSLFPAERAANRSNRLFAKLYLRGTEADGGTVMRPALHQALPENAPARNGARLRQVVFVTDGAVSNETELFRDIHRRLGASRLFTVGIGSAPNAYFMRKAAEAGRGSYVFIGDLNQVRAKMSALFRKLERAALTGLEFDWVAKDGGPVAAESFPAAIPDLYDGEPVILVSRVPSAQVDRQETLQLRAKGWARDIHIAAGRPAIGISAIWARAKITALADSRREGAPADAVQAAITRVGLTHNLVTRYTSLLATEKTVTRPAGQPLALGNVPLNLPHGWRFAKETEGKLLKKAAAAQRRSAGRQAAALQPVDLPQGATPFFIHLAAGIGLLAMTFLIFLAGRSRQAAA